MVGVGGEIVGVVIRPFLMGVDVKDVCRLNLDVTVFVERKQHPPIQAESIRQQHGETNGAGDDQPYEHAVR
jgi:hypothetical protein